MIIYFFLTYNCSYKSNLWNIMYSVDKLILNTTIYKYIRYAFTDVHVCLIYTYM